MRRYTCIHCGAPLKNTRNGGRLVCSARCKKSFSPARLDELVRLRIDVIQRSLKEIRSVGRRHDIADAHIDKLTLIQTELDKMMEEL